MITRRYFYTAACLIPLSQLLACASTPEHLYTIEAASVQNTQPPDFERPTVLLAPVTLPELIDRPQLVVRNGEYGVEINEQQRWAAPLKESLPKVIASELSLRLTGQNFIAASPNVIASPSARLFIEIASFDISRDGAGIAAHWAYRPADTHLKPIEGISRVYAAAKSAEYIDYVDAARRATLALADDIAAQLAK
ncbi:MAG: PqiC family protein [Methylomonas sp.]|jgi:uncharacterized lipoprotein YmbA